MAPAFEQLQACNVKTTLNINGIGLQAASSLQCQDNSLTLMAPVFKPSTSRKLFNINGSDLQAASSLQCQDNSLTLTAATFTQLQACNVKTTLNINGSGLQAFNVKTTL